MRRDRGKQVPAFAAGILALLTGACAATTIQVPRMKPAEVNLGSVKKVAIAEVEGEDGETIADRLTKAIMESERYEVFDRQHIATLRKEQALAAGEDGAGALGKILGASALIFGRVVKNGYSDTVNAQEAQCGQDGKLVKCTNYTRVGTHRLQVSFKVIDAVSSKVLATKTVTGEAFHKGDVQILGPKDMRPEFLASNVPSLGNRDEVKDAAIEEVIDSVMRMIAPYKVLVATILYEQSELPTSKAGVAAAKAGNWDIAIAKFREAVNAAEANPEPSVKARAHYNLGVALGYSGFYDEGVKEIEKAMTLEPDEVYQKEIAAIRSFKKDDERLRAQSAQ